MYLHNFRVWNETYVFSPVELNESHTIVFSLFDKDNIGKDDPVLYFIAQTNFFSLENLHTIYEPLLQVALSKVGWLSTVVKMENFT